MSHQPASVSSVLWHHAHFYSLLQPLYSQSVIWRAVRVKHSHFCVGQMKSNFFVFQIAQRWRINNFREPHLNFRWVNQRQSQRWRGRHRNVNKANCSITRCRRHLHDKAAALRLCVTLCGGKQKLHFDMDMFTYMCMCLDFSGYVYAARVLGVIDRSAPPPV